MVSPRLPVWLITGLVAGVLCACGTDSGSGESCPASREMREGECIDPLHIHDPAEPVVENRIRGPQEELQLLELPAAPNAGFRLVVPPHTIAPYEEAVICYSWQLPDLPYDNIYVAEVHTTEGLHHGNLIGMPIDKEQGPNPSPGCRPGAESFVDAYGRAFSDQAGVPQVLFASSTQVTGTERRYFPEGMAMRLGEDMEAVIGVHYLNPTGEPLRVEIAYDFYMAPDEAVEMEVVPFAFFYSDFRIPPQSEKTLVADCPMPAGGNIVSVMPHMHERGHAFRIEHSGGTRDGEVIYNKVGYDTESDIQTFEQPISVDGNYGLRFSCTFQNDLDVELTEGIGVNEMCILLGYMYPPRAQVAGFIPNEERDCFSLPIGEMLYDE